MANSHGKPTDKGNISHQETSNELITLRINYKPEQINVNTNMSGFSVLIN